MRNLILISPILAHLHLSLEITAPFTVQICARSTSVLHWWWSVWRVQFWWSSYGGLLNSRMCLLFAMLLNFVWVSQKLPSFPTLLHYERVIDPVTFQKCKVVFFLERKFDYILGENALSILADRRKRIRVVPYVQWRVIVTSSRSSRMILLRIQLSTPNIMCLRRWCSIYTIVVVVSWWPIVITIFVICCLPCRRRICECCFISIMWMMLTCQIIVRLQMVILVGLLVVGVH